MNNRFSSFLFASVVFLGLATQVRALPIGRLRQVRPVVQIQNKGKGWTVAHERNALLFGDTIRTGDKGQAEVLFNNGTDFLLRAHSQIKIEAPGSKTQSLVVRVVGALSEVFVRAKGPTQIRTAAGTAAVRGTEFLVRLDAETQTTLTVSEGAVAFFNPQGQVLVAAGQQSTAEVGKAPTPPVAVDVSGLLQWTADLNGVPLEIEWPFQTLDPKQARANLVAAKTDAERGRALYDLGRYGEAVEVLQNTGDALGLGSALAAAGDSRRAIRTLLYAGGSDSSHRIQESLESRFIRAILMLDSPRDYEVEEAQQILENNDLFPLAETGAALANLREGKWQSAEAHSRKALKSETNFFQARGLLALALVQQNRLPEAETEAQKAVQIEPFSAQSAAILSYALFFEGKTAEARRLAQKAVELNPLSPFALLTAGRAALASQNTDEAKGFYEQAAVLAPQMPIVFAELGSAYLRLDKPQKAEKAFRHALALAPTSAVAQGGLGLALLKQGQETEARRLLEAARDAEPKSPLTRTNLAQFFIETGDLEAAQDELETVAGDGPEIGATYIRLSEVALFGQKLNDALRFARKAVALLPASGLAHYQLGRVYLEQERSAQAQSQFRQAVVLDPQLARARYALGLSQERSAQGREPGRALGQIAAATESSPQQVLNIQNLQTPGTNERLQAALQDPTVVRSATRSFGDTQIDGSFGERDTYNATLSHLEETDHRRGVIGVTALRDHTDGVRSNAYDAQERIGVVWGQKGADSPSGAFVLGQYNRRRAGQDIGATSSSQVVNDSGSGVKPSLFVGYNWQNGERVRTRFLLGANQTKAESSSPDTSPTDFNRLDYRSLNLEVRHDRAWGQNHLLSAGVSIGRRSYLNNAQLTFAQFGSVVSSQGNRRVQAQTVYLRDEWRAAQRLTLTAELKGRRLRDALSTLDTPNPLAPPFFLGPVTSQSNQSGFVGLPTFVAHYQITPATGVRFRARRLMGSIEDFDLLSPTDVFLFTETETPQTNFFSRARRYELELDHTLPNSSFLRLGLFQQSAGNSAALAGDTLQTNRFGGVRLGYEGNFNPDTTFFVAADYNATRSVTNSFGAFSPNETLTAVPRVRAEVGLQFLNDAGFFFQPSLGYIGERARPDDLQTPRGRDGGFGLASLRVGKRWGLKSVAFVEVNNLFDKSYTVFSSGPEVFQPGRRVSFGFSRRF